LEGFFLTCIVQVANRRCNLCPYKRVKSKAIETEKRVAMESKQLSGMKVSDIKKLMQVPENEILGEVIRLNCTRYSNGLDVIRICTLIRQRKHKSA